MQNMEIYELKSEMLRVLAHPLRIRIIELLDTKELNVSEICTALNREQAVISKHLGILKSGGFLRAKKVGLNVFYSVDMCCLPKFLECLNSILGEKVAKLTQKFKAIK